MKVLYVTVGSNVCENSLHQELLYCKSVIFDEHEFTFAVICDLYIAITVISVIILGVVRVNRPLSMQIVVLVLFSSKPTVANIMSVISHRRSVFDNNFDSKAIAMSADLVICTGGPSTNTCSPQ